MNPTDILKYGHLTVLNTVNAFPKGEVYTTGACGYWSVKDLVAHLASFELVLVDVLNNLLDPGPTPVLDQYLQGQEEFNDPQVDLRKEMTMDEVLDEYKAAHQEVWAAAEQITPEIWEQEGILPWYGQEYDLEDFIVYTYYGHKREHCGQIAVFRDNFV